MAKKIETYRDLDYNKVVDWADKKELNTDTPENFREAAQAMFAEKYGRKVKLKFEAEIWNIIEKKEIIHTETSYDDAVQYCNENDLMITKTIEI